MANENSPAQGWRCPAPNCGKVFGELWRLRAHHRMPTKGGTRALQGHGTELLECPRCHEILSQLKTARHRCKLAPARKGVAMAAAAAQDRHVSMLAAENKEEAGHATKRRRLHGHAADKAGSHDESTCSMASKEDHGGEESSECAGPRMEAAVAAAVAAAFDRAGVTAGLEPRLMVQQHLHPTPRGAAAAAMLMRLSSGSVLSPAAPGAGLAQTAPPALPTCSPTAPADVAGQPGIKWWQAAVQPALGQGEGGTAATSQSTQQTGSTASPAPAALEFVHHFGPLPVAAPMPLAAEQPRQQEMLRTADAGLHMFQLPLPLAQHAPVQHVVQPQQGKPLFGPLASLAGELLGHLMQLLRPVVSDADAEEFLGLVCKHSAERQGADPSAMGAAGLDAGAAGQDGMFAGLVAELTVRCTAVRSLLEQGRQQELAEGVHGALRAARLAAAVTQLSALLARQPTVA